MRRYVTTAIDYPNAGPHMGHVLEKVLADVMVRWFRLRGDEVRFQIGTDEHGIKIQQTAEKQGMSPSDLVEKNVPLFRDLYAKLGISYDTFVRTTDREKHWPTVQAAWRTLRDAGVLEKRTYTGLYCAGCERFLTKKDLVEGRCPLHPTLDVQDVQEENWFFLLSKDEEWLKALLKSDYRIVPEFRAPEMLSLLEGGLEDVSFSRPTSSLTWGIPVPDEEGQVMYVWCDALMNYLSTLGYFTDHEERRWWDEAEVTHVIGKDIARFHALIWPAMLKHVGVRTPDRLLIHGFLTNEGQRMSKSTGNVVNPEEVLSKYGVDAMRFYLSHEVPVGNDGDFSWSHFANLYDGILRNQLGNLLNRVMVLVQKNGGEIAGECTDHLKMSGAVADHWRAYAEAMDGFQTHLAVQQAMQLVRQANELMQQHQPWSKDHAPEHRLVLLTEFAEILRHLSLMLLPFMPQTAVTIASQLGIPSAGRMAEKAFAMHEAMTRWGGEGEWKRIGEPSILFAPVE